MTRRLRLRAQNMLDEFERQKHAVAMLRAYMPNDVWWCASMSGIPLSPRIAAVAKRAGLERGAPDLSFIFPDGRTKYVEMKAPGGELTTEQKRLAQILGPSRFQVCHSWDELKAVLEVWLGHYAMRLLTDAESVRRAAGPIPPPTIRAVRHDPEPPT